MVNHVEELLTKIHDLENQLELAEAMIVSLQKLLLAMSDMCGYKLPPGVFEGNTK